MKTFTFEFDIKGKACLSVDASSYEEACKKIESGDGESSDAEWDFDFGWRPSYRPEDLKKHLVAEDDL